MKNYDIGKILNDLAKFDLIDGLFLFPGMLVAIAIGESTAPKITSITLSFWLLITFAQTIGRKTPILPIVLFYVVDALSGKRHIATNVIDAAAVPVVSDRRPAAVPVVSDRRPAAVPVVSDRRPAAVPVVISPVSKGADGYEPPSAVLPSLDGYHIAVVGPTLSGKSTVMKALIMQRRPSRVIVFDPHYEPGNWPQQVYVVGRGRGFPEFSRVIALAVDEMSYRYSQSGKGIARLDSFDPIYIVVDELTALADNEPDAIEGITTIAQEGRKARIFVMIAPHGQNVAAMGLEGRGDVRENFAFIRTGLFPGRARENPKEPRVVRVSFGAPRSTETEILGDFVVNPIGIFPGEPNFGVPQWLLARAESVPDKNSGHAPGAVPMAVTPISQVIPLRERTPETLSGHAPGNAEFSVMFGADSIYAKKMADMLASYGYSQRKIAAFLPIGSEAAREIARLSISRNGNTRERPSPGSKREIVLVGALHEKARAPLDRIAGLLDGNQDENLDRISSYLREKEIGW